MVAVTKHGAGGDPAGPLGRFPRTTAFIDELISLRVGGDAGVARLREARRWAAQAERRQSLSQTVAKNIRAVASNSIIRMIRTTHMLTSTIQHTFRTALLPEPQRQERKVSVKLFFNSKNSFIHIFH